MLQKTRGLVLHNIKYSDSSIISHIYTEGFGRMSFLITGTRGKKSSVRINLLGHLSILEMEVYIKQSRDLQRVKEIRLHENFSSIPYDPVKNAVALFISEILYRTLQEQEKNLPLFSFLVNAIKIFDISERGFANFHLIFLIGLTRHLGFFPQNNYSPLKEYFDIENALFTDKQPVNPYFISPPESRYLSELMSSTFGMMDKVKLNGALRNSLVTGLLDYYRFHLPGMGKLKSISVMKEIFD